MKHRVAFSTMALDQKIASGDSLWQRFNGSFVNRELEVMDIANEVYLGHPFTTWHKNNWRESANFLLGNHIGIDFDTGDERSSIGYLAKDDFIQKYASFIYTTPSHTTEKPKGRVLFLLDEPIHQGHNYTRSVMALLWLFGGLTTPDAKCKDPCRFFYGSKSCDIEVIHNVLPLALVRYLIEQYEASGQQQKRTVQKNSYTPNTTSEQEIKDALDSIPPWGIDYDQWLSVLMALHEHMGSAGLSLAESWGEGKDGEIRRKWSSFKANGNGTGKTTIKSVFQLAYQHGWQGPAKVQ